MSLNTPSEILDLTGWRDVPSGELGQLLERAVTENAPASALKAVTGLLRDRTLRLLRRGSRREILEESTTIHRFLAGPAGRALLEREPAWAGGWTALGELLSEAARRSDQAAVDSILLATKGRGRALLEELARAGRPLPRVELRRRLGLEESHLSHLLRDLEEAELVVRYREEGSREVLVDLGLVGREVVQQSVLPPWIERFVAAAQEIGSGRPFYPKTLAEQLEILGAPSGLAAARLAEVLVGLAHHEIPKSVVDEQVHGETESNDSAAGRAQKQLKALESVRGSVR